MAARLASDFWVAAYLARLMQEGIPAHIVRRGDPVAGSVIVKLAFMNGQASCFTRTTGADGERGWTPLMVEETETAVDEVLRRQVGYDPDLWLIEVEDPRGRHLLDREGLGA